MLVNCELQRRFTSSTIKIRVNGKTEKLSAHDKKGILPVATEGVWLM